MNDKINEKLKMKNEKSLPLQGAGGLDWVKTTLGEVCIFNYGKGLITENRIFGNIPVYGSSGITGWHNDPLINEKGLIIGRKGSVGTIYKSEIPFYPIDTVYYITQKDTKCDLEFLYRLLQSLGLDKKNSDSAVPGLNRENAYSTEILLPPLPEQQAIASVLSAFDDKIELLREQNKTLEEMGQVIFKRWFVDFEFGNGNDDSRRDVANHCRDVANHCRDVANHCRDVACNVSTGTGTETQKPLPEGWRVGKIIEIIKREPISYKCYKKDLDPKGKTPIIDQGSNGLYGYTSRNPDFVATKENPVILFTNHTCNYWFVDYPFCAIQNVLPYRGKDGYDECFLYFMTKGSITFIEYKGHWPDFEAKDFIIPPVEIAQKFSKIAKPILEKISDNNSQIQSLARSRDELLPRLMNGEVRVNF